MEEPRKRIFKIILVGGQAVGKSSLINRYIEGTFKDEYFATIGIDFKLHNVTVGEQQVKLQIWDTAGQERFQSLTSGHFKGAHGCICVLDITKSESVQSARYYLEQAISNYGMPADSVYLVANKVDLESERKVAQEEIDSLSEEFNVEHMNVSAKDGTGINKLFDDLTRKMMDRNVGNESLMYEGNPKIEFRSS